MSFSLAAIALLSSCGRDAGNAASPDGVTLARHARLSFEPVFPRLPGASHLADLVQFEKVRIVLHRADGTVALDTTVLFPVGADSVVLAADVPLASKTGNSGEVFKAELGYMNAAGDVVFKGGPVDLTVVPKGSNTTPPPIQIPVAYSGPGASAKRVVISPRDQAINEGQSFSFTAVATDAAGTIIPNTPIVWAALDPSRAVLSSNLSGLGRALNARGTARIAAQLLTGPADTITLTINLLPKNLSLVSGSGQKGVVGTALGQAISAKVTASDGVGVAGVTVGFAVTAGGGTVANSAVTTDASGVASTTWTLGSTVGNQTATASVSGLSGSPVSFTATARSVAPVKLVVVSAPSGTNAAGTPMAMKVQALDAQGDVAKTFTGPVSLALGGGAPGVSLLGVTTVNAVDGVASFNDVRINIVGAAYTLTASATGLLSATTGAFEIIAGPAKTLRFSSYPVGGFTAGAPQSIGINAVDAAGNIATSFSGSVTLVTTGVGAGIPLAATRGIAQFDDYTITRMGAYTLTASATGLTSAVSPTFDVRAGPAAALSVIAGSGQVGPTGSTLPQAVVVSISDRFANPVLTSGVTVTFTASDGGSASPASTATASSGMASTSWRLGGAAGTQRLTASAAGLSGAYATATATSTGGASVGDLVVIDDVNAWDDGLGLWMSGSTYAHPGNAQFVRNVFGFSISGARAGANKVLLINDQMATSYVLGGYNWSNFSGILVSGLGLTWTISYTHTPLNTIASDVKVVMLRTPSYYFSTTEINGLKAFVAEGGRILFIGENGGYYQYQAVENNLIQALGSPMTVVPDCAAPGEMVRTSSHPLTAGIAASGSGSFYMNCASHHTLHGTNDAPIFYDASNRIVGSVLKVNTTPSIPVDVPVSALRALRAAEESARLLRQPGPDKTIAPRRNP